jgi:hypothetical protein
MSQKTLKSAIASCLIIWAGRVTRAVNLQIYIDLQYFGQIDSVTHVMSIKFKNNIKTDLTGTEIPQVGVGGGVMAS